MDQKQLEALARRNAAKSQIVQKKMKRVYDATLDATRPDEPDPDSEAQEIFREMKKREF
ncbi:MAG TPA: hypothetical protein VFW89_05250 [Gemmatimonadaceae bacterium]|nr:hypothetical protein [Gemmatimonadaceae bacterium]